MYSNIEKKFATVEDFLDRGHYAERLDSSVDRLIRQYSIMPLSTRAPHRDRLLRLIARYVQEAMDND